MASDDLVKLAATINEWLRGGPGFRKVYLFGSRVRGDHRPDSDVDLRIFLTEDYEGDEATLQWWQQQNATDFAELKAALPGPLSLHVDGFDAADAKIRKGAQSPVHVDGRVICVWTDP